MRRRRHLFTIFLSLALAACAGNSCGPEVPMIDLVGPDECTPAGGTCFGLFCPSGTHVENLSGCGIVGTCCLPGEACEGRCQPSCGKDQERGSGSCSFSDNVCCKPRFVPSPGFDDGAPITPRPDHDATATGGFCDLAPCAAGCTCRARASDDAGTCEAACDCPDASTVAADAGNAADGGGGGDAGDAGDGGSTACGVVTCADGCTCLSAATGECVCASTGCAL